MAVLPTSIQNYLDAAQPLTDKTQGALRYDTDKPRYDLVPPDGLRGLVMVYTMGAKKYAPWNWLKGMDWSRCDASLQRHLQAWREGEDFDKESGLHHMFHVAWNAITLAVYALRGIGKDDRYNKQPTV